LKRDPEFVLNIFQQNQGKQKHDSEIKILKQIDFDIVSDRNFLRRAVRINAEALSLATKDIRKDEEFVLELIGINYECFGHCHKKLRRDRDFALKAVRIDARSMGFCDGDLVKDQHFLMEIYKAKTNKECDIERSTKRRRVVADDDN